MPRTPFDFPALVREHHAAVFRSALRVTGDAAAASDVTQEVFLRVLEGKQRLDRAASVRAVLCWLATRLGANAVRARRRRQGHEENAMHHHDLTPIDPAEACSAADLAAAVQRHVDALPADLRLPLLLRCQDELDYRAIGSALAIGESTAHDRVQRALQQLRRALGGRGLALAAADVERALGAAAPAAPAGLEAVCLQLAPRAGLVTGALAKAAVAVLAVAVATVLAFELADRTAPSPAAVVAAAEPFSAAAPFAATDGRDPGPSGLRSAVVLEPATDAPPAGVQDPAPAVAVVFTGTVHDAAAWPVADAAVVAVASGGLKPFVLGTARTDAAGAFRLELTDERNLRPSAVRLRVIEGKQVLLETADLAVPPPADTRPLALVLPASAGIATERFAVTATVRGPDGQPVAGALARLLRGAGPKPELQRAPDHEGTTDARGEVRFLGRTLGDHWLFVDGRALGLGTRCLPLVQLRAGLRSVAVELAAGRSWSGTVRGLDGSVLDHLSVWVEDERTGVVTSGEVGAGGEVRFAGLDEGPYTLQVQAWGWSPARRTGLAPGSPFAVQCKRADDERAHGDHMAELHGELVDGATGEPVSFQYWDVDTFALVPGTSTLLWDRMKPPGPFQRHDDGKALLRFHKVGLAAGSWALVAHLRGKGRAAVGLDLADGELRTVRLALQRGGEAHGVVQGAGDAPVAKAHVFVVGVGELADRLVQEWQQDERQRDPLAPSPSVLAASVRSGADGSFALRGVPCGAALRLVAVHGGRAVVSPPFEMKEGERIERLVLRLP